MGLITTVQVLRMFGRMLGRVPTAHLWYLLRRMVNEKPHRFAGQTRINTFFPPYPSPAFDRFCHAVIARRRVPYSTYLAVTTACPYHCDHCSYAGRSGTPMSREQMLDVVQQIKGLGACTLGLTGGEPLLRADLEEIIAAAAPEMVSVVFTTGHGLDTARARRLAEAGTSCVTIGLEFSDAETHDFVRGQPGSFAEAEAAVRACREAGVYTAISTMATRQKLDAGELYLLYDLGARRGVGEFRILAPVATGRLFGCSEAMLTRHERQELIDFHIEHNRRSDGPAVASFAYLESDEVFGCGAGYHHLFIDSAGQVCPCDLTPMSFGDVTKEPLADIWKRMGEYFPTPRRGCMFGQLVSNLSCISDRSVPLPLPQTESERLCTPPNAHSPLPEGYRRLLRRRR